MRNVSISLLILCAAMACVSTPVLHVGAPAAPCGASPSSRSIRWVRAVEARERRASSRWCDGVGGPVVAESPRVVPEATLPLTVISWNTHVGGGDLARLVRDARAGRLTGTAARAIVLLLQEVYRGSDSVPAAPPAGARFAAAETPSPPESVVAG